MIVGGGIIGCALAESLARRGCRVTVLEAATVGAEASSVAAGMLAPQVEAAGPGPFLDLALASRALFPQEIARLEHLTGLHVDFQPVGILALIFTEHEADEASQRLAWQTHAGLPIQRLTREELLRREPGVAPSVRWALCYPEDHNLDSRQLTLAYAEAARRAGATIVEGVHVARLAHDGRRVRGVVTDTAHEWLADIVVDTAGSWAAFDPALPFRIPVEPAKGMILTYDLRHQTLPKRPIKRGKTYLVPRSDGRLLVGTTVEFVGYDRSIAETAVQELAAQGAGLYPALAQMQPAKAVTSFRPTTPDRVPILGTTPLENLYLATGHFRNGILLAPITARVMTELMLAGRSSIDLTPFRLDRFTPDVAVTPVATPRV